MGNKIFLLFWLFCSICIFAGEPAWTSPRKVHVSAFAVDYYYNEWADSLPKSVAHKNAFISYLFSALERKYPQKNKYVPYNFDNEQATVNSYIAAQLYHSEFVFFAGHGNQQAIALYDNIVNLNDGCGYDVCPPNGYGKVYGGDIRWVVLSACLTLNVNQTDKLAYPLSLESIDYSKVNKLRSVFHGAHAILGYYALGWQSVNLRGSEDIYRYFVQYFIDDGESIWDAYNYANASLYRDFEEYYSYYGMVPYGLKPAIAFLRGFDENGVYHDTSNERFDYTYNRPIEITGSLEMFIMYNEYGTPIYE
jgi:hypothetical protein